MLKAPDSNKIILINRGKVLGTIKEESDNVALGSSEG